MPADNPQARNVLLEEPFTKSSEAATRRALKIAKLFQRHRGIGVAANVDRFGLGRLRESLVFRNRPELLLLSLRPIKDRSASKRDQRDPGDNYKRQVAFHGIAEERKTSAQRVNRQVVHTAITGTSSHTHLRIFGKSFDLSTASNRLN